MSGFFESFLNNKLDLNSSNKVISLFEKCNIEERKKILYKLMTLGFETVIDNILSDDVLKLSMKNQIDDIFTNFIFRFLLNNSKESDTQFISEIVSVIEYNEMIDDKKICNLLNEKFKNNNINIENINIENIHLLNYFLNTEYASKNKKFLIENLNYHKVVKNKFYNSFKEEDYLFLIEKRTTLINRTSIFFFDNINDDLFIKFIKNKERLNEDIHICNIINSNKYQLFIKYLSDNNKNTTNFKLNLSNIEKKYSYKIENIFDAIENPLIILQEDKTKIFSIVLNFKNNELEVLKKVFLEKDYLNTFNTLNDKNVNYMKMKL